MSPHESEDMTLPYCNNAVKDLHISPAARNLVLFSSLGKKLAILRCCTSLELNIGFFLHIFFSSLDLSILSNHCSMESNHIILDYDLPVKFPFFT